METGVCAMCICDEASDSLPNRGQQANCAMCMCDEASDSLPNRGQQAKAPLDWKTNV